MREGFHARHIFDARCNIRFQIMIAYIVLFISRLLQTVEYLGVLTFRTYLGFLCLCLQEERLDAAVEELLKLEKEVRSTADLPKVQRVVMAIIELCFEARAWRTLLGQVLSLSQRPDQSKQVSSFSSQASLVDVFLFSCFI